EEFVRLTYGLVRTAPVPQHPAVADGPMLDASPNWSGVAPLNMPLLISGEKNVAPPVDPTRNSFTMLADKVDRSDSDVVHRVDCWLPVFVKPGNDGSAPFVVSGVELMCW